MPDQMVFSGESPILQSLTQLASSHSPWLRCDSRMIAIDWPLFFKSMVERDIPSAPSMSTQKIDLLSRMAPSLDLRNFILNERLSTFALRSDDQRTKSTWVVKTTTKSIALDKHLIDLLGALKKRSDLEEKFLIQEACDKPTGKSPWYEAEWNAAIEARRDRIFRAGRVIGIAGAQLTSEYSFYPGKRFLVHRGPMLAFLRGRTQSYFGNRPVPSHRQMSHALTRRLIRLHLDLLAAITPLSKETGEDASSTVIDIIMRMGEIEGRLYQHLTKPIDVRFYPEGREEERSAFITKKQTLMCRHRELGWVDEKRVSEWCMGARHRGENGFSSDYYPHQNSRATADHAPLQNGLADLYNYFRRLSFMPDESHECELNNGINFLISHSPLLSLLASGFLATYPLSSQLADASCENYGICLSPWATTSYLCQCVTGAAPMTTIHADEHDEEPSPQDEENESEQGERNSAESTLSMGMQLWQQVKP